jgi:MOSC domain-containing protein YiiM
VTSPDAAPGTLLAVCRVHALVPVPGHLGVSAIDKREVGASVRVHRVGLRGDVQVSRRHHGGPDKAVYAYAQESARWWSERLGREVPPGLFGENLRTGGVDVDGALVGERWQVGGVGRGPLLEVTMPRTPCATFTHRMREPDWHRRFAAAGRPGAYLRVLRTGSLRAGDAVTVVHRPAHGVTVGAVSLGSDPDGPAALRAAVERGEVDLADAMRPYLLPASDPGRPAQR